MNTKEIIFSHINETNGNVNIQKLTDEIRAANPRSKWDYRHWNFYRSQITSPRGRYTHIFSDQIKENLKKVKYADIDRQSTQPDSVDNQRSIKTGGDKWPNWDIPNEEEQIFLARALMPYIKILDPNIVELVVADNNKNLSVWTDQFVALNIRPDIYLWEDSPVCFPGIRRHVGKKEASEFRNNTPLLWENALYLDDNSFPKEIWSFALRNKKYVKTNPPHYALAHIIDHKDYKTRNSDELIGFQKSEDTNLFAGLYTACTNTVYVPTTFLKPTDHNSKIRLLLIQIVLKYFGSICNVLPHKLSFNLDNIEDQWRLENFPPPTLVGRVANTDNFISYRNSIINSRVLTLLQRLSDGNKRAV